MVKKPSHSHTETVHCAPGDPEHKPRKLADIGEAAFDRAAGLFRAAGDVSRLRLLAHLSGGERCVSELSETMNEGLSTISQRLRLLRTEGLISRRREGRHIFYTLADKHVADLLRNALEHASEVTHHHLHDEEDEP
jgi:ArsR family transcriptional regulator, lead/cadmium/zinc/bismuth-responsive transcriptional repressor